MTEGKCGFALQLPGPIAKTGYDYGRLHRTHDKTGITIHTAEYDTSQDEPTLHNALFSGREASWHFTITKEGWLFQHYPVDAVTWHCGYGGNLWTVGIECEGYAPNKISGPQYGLLVKLLRWIREDRRWTGTWKCGDPNAPLGWTDHYLGLYEHSDWMPTLCQVFSRGMIDAEQLIRDLKEEPMPEPFTEKQEDRIKEIVNWCGPGLEMQARLVISRALHATEGVVMVGDWEELPGRLADIKELAQLWHRCEE